METCNHVTVYYQMWTEIMEQECVCLKMSHPSEPSNSARKQLNFFYFLHSLNTGSVHYPKNENISTLRGQCHIVIYGGGSSG